uniref:2'-phosphotransferase n=1 Tax=Trypanosoma congolense (strain IL3000) TaxID=1068625 RepID=G0V0I8_TRYCI|nr:putative phosphotransferase [Trypanosoma congolense IL3000]
MHLAVDPFLLRHEYCYCPNVVASQSLVTSTGVQHHLEPFISKKKHMSAYPPAKHRPACDWEERCLNEGGQRQSPFDVYVILDFEATCERGKRICVPEVIEFPMILLDALTGRTIAEFQQYVRPVVNPRLSDFCTELVGIRQETVDKADTFPSVFSSAMNFLQQNGCGDTPSSKRHLFITFGDWDLKTMLPLQLQACCDQGVSICVPPFLRRWCNIKRLMQQMLFQGVWQAGLRFIRDIPDMMNILSLEMQGRHHSGIDDCRNIAAAVAKLIQAGYVFAPTTDNSGLTPPNYPCAPLSSTGHMDNSLAPGGVPVVFDCASKVEGSDMTARKRRLSNGNVQAEARKRPFINIVKYEYPLRSLLGAAREDGNACYTPLSQEKMIGYSKALSRILRHRADKMGITITDTGYVLVEDLLRYAPFSGDPAALLHIAQVVETNDKQRFRMGYDDAGRVFVCANQGHSLPGVNPELVRIANVSQVPTAFHGTSFSAWKKIRACGYLSTMERQHIHFAKGVPGDSNVISGMRSSSEVVLALNVPLVLEDGIELWESANGVLLTPGAGNTRQLPLKYIASAVDRQTGESLFF